MLAPLRNKFTALATALKDRLSCRPITIAKPTASRTISNEHDCPQIPALQPLQPLDVFTSETSSMSYLSTSEEDDASSLHGSSLEYPATLEFLSYGRPKPRRWVRLPRVDIQDIWNDGISLYKSADYRAAAQLFQQLSLRVFDGYIKCILCMNSGLAFIAAQDLDAAQDAFMIASSCWSTSCLPLFLGGVTAYANGRPGTGVWMFHHCLSSFSGDQSRLSRTYNHLGFPLTISAHNLAHCKAVASIQHWHQENLLPTVPGLQLHHRIPYGVLFESRTAYANFELDCIISPFQRVMAEPRRPKTPPNQGFAQFKVYAEPDSSRASFDRGWSFSAAMPAPARGDVVSGASENSAAAAPLTLVDTVLAGMEQDLASMAPERKKSELSKKKAEEKPWWKLGGETAGVEEYELTDMA